MLTKNPGHIFSSQNIESIAPSQRMHLILLGVENIAKSRAFYEALGWSKSPTGHDEFVKFNLGGYALCLISRAALAADALAEPASPSGFNGVAFVYLAKSPEEVPAILAKAVEAGRSTGEAGNANPLGNCGLF